MGVISIPMFLGCWEDPKRCHLPKLLFALQKCPVRRDRECEPLMSPERLLFAGLSQEPLQGLPYILLAVTPPEHLLYASAVLRLYIFNHSNP